MATVIPSEPLPGTPGSEIRALRALSRLDSGWQIFHSVAWQSKRNGREGDGEADIVMLHPTTGLVVLEVKGGLVRLVDGQWFSENRHTGQVHQIKDPFRQAVASKYALIRLIEDTGIVKGRVPIVHGVVLPDIRVSSALGLDAPRAIVLDQEDLQNVASAIPRLIAHWGPQGIAKNASWSKLAKILAPTVTARITLRNAVSQVKEKQIELTERQIFIMKGLRSNRRAVITGSAGTGKTVLAAEQAQLLATQGFQTLLVVYNRLLADQLQRTVANARIEIRTFHQLCGELASRAKVATPTDPPQEWWEHDAPNLLISAATALDFRFDALIVDEGQDFSEDWFQALLMLLADPDQGPVYLFLDEEQSIYNRGWTTPTDWTTYNLDLNCRNTLPIARVVAGVFDREPTSLGTGGPAAQFVVASTAGEALDVAQRVISDLLQDEELEANQCVFLGDRLSVEEMRQRSVADYLFVAIDGSGVVAETIPRFKGLEADAVIINIANLNLDDNTDRALAYIGLSRARSLLFVIGTKKQKRQLNWNRR